MLAIFTRECKSAYAEGGLFLLTMRPHLIGYRSRILETLLERITVKGDVRIATHAKIAEHVRSHADL